MNKRGWLASGLLAAAVIGGYLGLLPLLSSLAAGPAWPDPIATRDASGVITVTAPANGNAAQGEGTTPASEAAAVRAGDGNDGGDASEPAETTGGDETIPVVVKPTKKSSKVTVVVAGGLERVTPKPAIVTRPSNGGSSGGSASGGSSGGSGGSSGGGSSAGGSGGGSATPSPDLGPLDGVGAGQVAGGGQQDNGDDEASAGG